MASPEDLISLSPVFENEIIAICGNRQKCPRRKLFTDSSQLGKYFDVGLTPITDINRLVPIDDILVKPTGGIHISNGSDYYIGFDLYKDGALLFSHSSSSSGEYLAPGNYIEYIDTSTATYAIDLAMHYSDGHGTIDQLCPNCQKQILINRIVPDTDVYTISTQLNMMVSIILDVQDKTIDPPDPPDPPSKETNDVEIQIRNLNFDPISWSIYSQHPVTSTITVQYFYNGSAHTLGTISKGQSYGGTGNLSKSIYNSISYWRCIPSSDDTYNYVAGPNEYQ